MIALMFALVIGQVNPQANQNQPSVNQITPLPPAPAPAERTVEIESPPPPLPASTLESSPNSSSTTEDLKVWLLTRLMVELSFNEEKIKEVEVRLDKMSDRQVRMLIEVYKDRVAKRDQYAAYQQWYMSQQVMNQAQLDLMRANGYKEHLQREHQQRILQGERETNLVRQNIMNNNRNGFGYGGGYGGFNNYNFGYGIPRY